jgi:hypothetical protein
MAKVNRAQKQREELEVTTAEQQDLKGLPHADKPIAFAEELVSSPAGTGNTASTVKQNRPAPEVPPARRFSAADAASEAGAQIEGLVRMKVDSVSAVTRSETGWNVVVNVIELARIPHSTDVLASYNVTLDTEGNLQSYNRGVRYTRGQTGDCL